jgi:hypothetical protein
MTRITRMISRSPIPRLLLLATLTTSGCGTNDDDAGLIREVTRRQAAQQESLQQQSQALTEASRELVESDARSRQELVEFQSRLQQELQAERQELNQQRDALENERREIARQRHRDPLLATALIQPATLIVAVLPIVLLILLLRLSHQEGGEQVQMSELLVDELLDSKTPLLPAPDEKPASIEHNDTAG